VLNYMTHKQSNQVARQGGKVPQDQRTGRKRGESEGTSQRSISAERGILGQRGGGDGLNKKKKGFKAETKKERYTADSQGGGGASRVKASSKSVGTTR